MLSAKKPLKAGVVVAISAATGKRNGIGFPPPNFPQIMKTLNRWSSNVEVFYPRARTPEQTEKIWSEVRRFTDKTMDGRCTDRRIFRLEFEHGPKRYEAEVGKFLEPANEIVYLILESGERYFVCTLERGVHRGPPVLVGAKSVLSILDFDTESPS